MKTKYLPGLVLSGLVAGGLFILTPLVFAAVSVTLATGGSAISADTAGATYTNLTGPVITEGATADIGVGTIILNAPSGFVFDTGGTAPTVLVTRTAGRGANNRNINDLASGSTIAVTRTTSTLTITITAATSNAVRNSLTWQNVRVRPSAGTPLASGNITKSGTSVIAGITAGVTNLGTLTEVPGTKNKLAFTTQPSATANINTDFTIKPVVKVQDQFGNTVTTDTSAITRTAVLASQICGGTAGSGVLTSTPVSGASAVAGVLTYTVMQYSVAENIRLCVSSTGITSALSNSINIVSPATKFVILPPGNGNIDDPLTVVIEAQDNSGIVDTTYQQDVTLVANNSATGGGLVNIVNGRGTTTISDLVVENVHLSLSDTENTNLNISSTQDISFGPGATKELLLAGGGSLSAGSRLPLTVTRKDRLGNLVTAGSESFYLYSDGAGTAKKFYDAASGGNIVDTVTISAGNSAASVWYYDEKVGSAGLTVSDNPTSPDGATGVIDGILPVTISAGSVAAFYLSDPGNLVAGNRLAYTVTRKDGFGNLVTASSTAAYLYHDSTATSTAFYGVASGGSPVANISFSDGASDANFWLYADHASSFSVTASDNAGSPDGATGIDDSSDSVTVSAGPVAVFSLNDPGDMTVATRLGYTASRQDAFGNMVTSGISNVYLYHNSSVASSTFYDAGVGGNTTNSITINDGFSSGNFWFYAGEVGSFTVTVSDSSGTPDGGTGIADDSDVLVVNDIPAVASRFIIIDHADAVVGSVVPITVKAVDGYGRVDTTYNNDVTLHTSGDATPAGVVDIVSGVGTINITDTKAEMVSLTLEDTASTGLDVSSSKTINFLAGPVGTYLMTGSMIGIAGDRLAYTISRQDSYGNNVTSGLSTVYLYSNSSAGDYSYFDAASGGSPTVSVTIPNGSLSTQTYYEGYRSGDWVLSASDNGTAPDGGVGIVDGTSTLAISPAATSRLSLDDPGDMTVGTRLPYTATRYDRFNNPVVSGTASYYLYSNSTGTTSAFYTSPIGGSPVTNLTFSGDSTANFWYYDATPGAPTVYLSDNSSSPDGVAGVVDGEDGLTVSPTPIVATRFVILGNTSSLLGTPVEITVRAVNDDGDIDTTYNNDVTLRASGSATGEGLVNIVAGVGHISIRDTTEETVNLTLLDSELTGLDVSATFSIIFSSVPLPPSGGGGSGGGGGLATPSVTFTGRAFPGAKLSILTIRNGQIPVSEEVTSGAGGSFNVNFSGTLPDEFQTFALVARDRDSLSTQTRVYNLRLNGDLFQNVFLPPTLNLKSEVVMKGGMLGLAGSAVPGYKIEVIVDEDKIIETATAGNDGRYELLYNTYKMSVGDHNVRVRQVGSDGRPSDYSNSKNFLVTSNIVSAADLNRDGVVNATDWGLFIAKWNATSAADRSEIDINHDSKTDIQDWSVFIKAFTRK